MPAGRPTDYSPAVIENAIHYLEHYNEDPYNDRVPMVVGLCKAIGRSKTTVYRWKDEEGKEEFRDILEQINEAQEKALCNGGLGNDFNSNITKLMMTKHGYSDKNELTGKDGDPIVPDSLNDMELARRLAFIFSNAAGKGGS